MQTIASQSKINEMRRFLFETNVVGCVVEVGVFEGGSLSQLAEFGRPCYGYDTFCGMPATTNPLDHHKQGDFPTSIELVKKNLEKFQNVTLIPGIYPESDIIKPKPIAMAHLDVDLYESTLNSLEHLWPFMATGGRIYFDDVFMVSCQGATLAMCDFCSRHRCILHGSTGPTFYLQK